MAERTALGTRNYLREGYEDVLSNERRALLALTAQHGSDAQIEYDRQKADAEAARRTSLEAAAARGNAVNAPEALQAELTQNYDRLLAAMSDGATASKLTHGREMDRIAAANAAYIDAMRAQAPLLQSELDAQVAAMKAQAEAEARGRSGGGGGGGGGGFGGLLGAPAEEERVLPTMEEARDTLVQVYQNLRSQGASHNDAMAAVYAEAEAGVADGWIDAGARPYLMRFTEQWIGNMNRTAGALANRQAMRGPTTLERRTAAAQRASWERLAAAAQQQSRVTGRGPVPEAATAIAQSHSNDVTGTRPMASGIPGQPTTRYARGTRTRPNDK